MVIIKYRSIVLSCLMGSCGLEEGLEYKGSKKNGYFPGNLPENYSMSELHTHTHTLSISPDMLLCVYIYMYICFILYIYSVCVYTYIYKKIYGKTDSVSM